MNPPPSTLRPGSTWRNRYVHEGGPRTAPQLPNQFTVLGVRAQARPLLDMVSVRQVGAVQTLATEWPVSQFLNEFEEISLA
jgi:hypothetical protein